jgi:hypothetical protein
MAHKCRVIGNPPKTDHNEVWVEAEINWMSLVFVKMRSRVERPGCETEKAESDNLKPEIEI